MTLDNPPTRIRVSYHSRDVGALALTPDHLQAFEYDEAWLAKGFSISPLSLPLEKRVFIAKAHPLDGAFGVFDDSMPDGWGRLLVDRALPAHGIDPQSLTSLARLSIVGTSGMGALEYRPETPMTTTIGGIDLDQIAQSCSQILRSEFSEDLDALFALGGSSGGARPKILTDIDGEEWIIKFASSSDSPDIGAEEYAISLAAKECGLAVPETRLFPSKRCKGYFGVERFDRVREGSGTRKVHMLSAGAALETSHRIPNLDYETLMRLTLRLTGRLEDVSQLFRLMCFNVFLGNRDDHAKNFSYLYNEELGSWVLAPAYDLTRSPGVYGERATTVNGKGKGIAERDLRAVGEKVGIPSHEMTATIREVRRSLKGTGLLDAEYDF